MMTSKLVCTRCVTLCIRCTQTNVKHVLPAHLRSIFVETREEEEERVRMAPNMGAGGSHTRAISSDPGEEEAAEGEH